MKFTTPIKKVEVELKDWITGREEREINKVLLDSTEFDQGGIKNFSASSATLADDKAFEIIIISIDGDKNDIVNKVLDMPSTDTAFIKIKVDQVRGVGEESEQKKTKQNEN